MRLRRWTSSTLVIGVQDLFAQYAHRIDGRDFDGFGELFTADADYSLAGNAQQGRDAIKDFMRGVMTNPGGTHIITNVSVRDDGDGRLRRRSPTTCSPAVPRPTHPSPSSASASTTRPSCRTTARGASPALDHHPAVSDDTVSFAERIAQLAEDDATSPVVRVVAVDGTETVVTWPELHRRSTQIARASAGARRDGRRPRSRSALRNSPEFVMTVLAAWKLGAVPVPVRWDLPDWERERVLEVIDGVSVGVDDLPWLEATHDLDPTPLPPAVSPMTNGICSSGSTGAVKVILMDKPGIFDEMTGMPFAAHVDARSSARRPCS